MIKGANKNRAIKNKLRNLKMIEYRANKGLNDAEIARVFKITKERVRQIFKRIEEDKEYRDLFGS